MKSIEGKVNFQRTSDEQCVCCEGGHVFSKSIEITPYPSIHAGLEVSTVSDFVNEFISTAPNIENKRVRVSIEVLD